MASLSSRADDEEERKRRSRLVMLDVDAEAGGTANSSTTTTAATAAMVEERAVSSTPPNQQLARPCGRLLYFSRPVVNNDDRRWDHGDNDEMKRLQQMRWEKKRRQMYEETSNQQKEIQLCKSNEVPDFLKINPYILYGYRPLLPLHLCLKSIFIWSNETINIWSHLLGCLIFIVLLPYDNIYTIPNSSGTLADHIVCSVSLICYQICMICSAGYHVFYCHSPQANVRWLAFDLSGIVVGLMGCYIPGVHYAFYCVSLWENLYLFSVIVLSLIILTIQLNPKRLSDSLAFTISRVLMYSLLACYGIIPSAHWFYMNGGWKTEIVRVFIPKLISMYLIGLGAIFFYLFHFPERLSPGSFDIIGASHQIWHVFIFFSLIWWRKSYLEVLDYRTSNTCKSDISHL